MNITNKYILSIILVLTFISSQVNANELKLTNADCYANCVITSQKNNWLITTWLDKNGKVAEKQRIKLPKNSVLTSVSEVSPYGSPASFITASTSSSGASGGNTATTTTSVYETTTAIVIITITIVRNANGDIISVYSNQVTLPKSQEN